FPAESLCAPSALTTARTGPFSSITAVEAASFEDVYVVVQVPQDVPPGAGPVIASPVLVPLVTSDASDNHFIQAIKIRFSDGELRRAGIHCDGARSRVICGQIRTANVSSACIGQRDACICCARSHCCLRIHQYPFAGLALAQGMVPLANGTPAVTGSLVRATPVMPGYFISCMVKGTLSWAADREEKRTA